MPHIASSSLTYCTTMPDPLQHFFLGLAQWHCMDTTKTRPNPSVEQSDTSGNGCRTQGSPAPWPTGKVTSHATTFRAASPFPNQGRKEPSWRLAQMPAGKGVGQPTRSVDPCPPSSYSLETALEAPEAGTPAHLQDTAGASADQ